MITYKKGILGKLKHDRREVKRKKNKKSNDPIWYDNIFCFDIETTSCFKTPSGEIMPYDYGKPEEFYNDCEKFGVMYHWQFGIEYDEGMHVLAGRTWTELCDFITELNEHYPHNKICYCHNLSMEFHHLLNILSFNDVFARKPHRVLTADCGTLHFRCSYFLVNMSLASWAESRRLPVKKLTGALNYNILRTPFTPIEDPDELLYMENDILVMYYGLKQYREKYRSLYKIPLTQTGEIRVVLEELTAKEYNLHKMCTKLIPTNLNNYRFYMEAFGGGDVHASMFYSDRLLHNVHSADIASSYPWACISEKYIVAPPIRVETDPERFMYDDFFAYIVCFEAYGITSRLCNTFLSFSRCLKVVGYRIDNGRVISADYVMATMYKHDFEMFTEFYNIQKLDIIDFRVAPVRPMNNKIRQWIINLYYDKTQLKGNEERHDDYIFIKQCLNGGSYGDQVQRQFEDMTVFTDRNTWEVERVNDEKYVELYNKKVKAGYKLYKSTLTGIAIPSAARRNLWRGIIKPLDDKIVYFDTDCGKWLGSDDGTISAYNLHVLRQHYRIADELGIDVNMLSPEDPSGECHPIGCLEYETGPTGYSDFKTLGAKKYAYTENGKIKITIAGVPKKNAVKLKSVDDLSEDLTFTPEECGKNILYYNTEQSEITFPDGFISREKYGICFQPTGYKVGLSSDYVGLLTANKSLHDHSIDTLIQVLNEKGEEEFY